MCDDQGVFIGPNIALVQRHIDGAGNKRFIVTAADHISSVLKAGHGESFDARPYLPGLARVATALQTGDLALANIALVQLRLPPFQSKASAYAAAVTDDLLKARWNERWPEGTPPPVDDGKTPGGQFRPRTDEENAALRAQRLPDRPLTPRERLLQAARDTIRQIRTALGYTAPIVEVLRHLVDHQFDIATNDALKAAKDPPKAIEQLRASRDNVGFCNMKEFVSAYGKAGSGYDWHHIVEQTDDNISEMGPVNIHSTKNVVRVPTLIHQEISDYYSMKDPQHPGYTRRSWLQTKRFDVQYAEGLKILKIFGVLM